MDGKGGMEEIGHSNRVFSVRFSIEDNGNKLVSGGWDNRIIGWDLRTGDPVQSIKGRMTVSDGGISVVPRKMLSSSYSNDKQLAMYDVQTFKEIEIGKDKENLEWINLDIDEEEEDESEEGEEEEKVEEKIVVRKANLYCGCFSSDGKFVLAGGAVRNEARIMSVTGSLIYRIYGLARPVICCDWNKGNSQFCLGGSDGFLRLYDLDNLPEIYEEGEGKNVF